jgi:hypothetical protein
VKANGRKALAQGTLLSDLLVGIVLVIDFPYVFYQLSMIVLDGPPTTYSSHSHLPPHSQNMPYLWHNHHRHYLLVHRRRNGWKAQTRRRSRTVQFPLSSSSHSKYIQNIQHVCRTGALGWNWAKQELSVGRTKSLSLSMPPVKGTIFGSAKAHRAAETLRIRAQRPISNTAARNAKMVIENRETPRR